MRPFLCVKHVSKSVYFYYISFWRKPTEKITGYKSNGSAEKAKEGTHKLFLLFQAEPLSIDQGYKILILIVFAQQVAKTGGKRRILICGCAGAKTFLKKRNNIFENLLRFFFMGQMAAVANRIHRTVAQ